MFLCACAVVLSNQRGNRAWKAPFSIAICAMGPWYWMATMTKAMSFAEGEVKWKELVRLLRETEKVRDAFDPFHNRTWTQAERLAEWNKLNDAVDEVRRRMDKFIKTV
jgi:hypothetical protein